MGRFKDLTIEIVTRVGDDGSEWRCVVEIVNESCCSGWFRRAVGGGGPWIGDDHPPAHVRFEVVGVLSKWVRDQSGDCGA